MMRSSGRTDPIVSYAFREALTVGAICLIAGIWTVGYCYLDGYHRAEGDMPLVAGMPRWAFWGILVPWLICAAISAGFAFVLMKDSELGADETSSEDQQPADEQGANRA